MALGFCVGILVVLIFFNILIYKLDDQEKRSKISKLILFNLFFVISSIFLALWLISGISGPLMT